MSAQRRVLIKAFDALGIELMTSPNYSLFTDVPRHDNLYNMKRVGVSWYECVDSKMPSALHLNARTLQDYARLTEFVQQRAEVTDVAFEFKTGGAWRARRDFHHAQLVQLALRARKPLRLVMIGGFPAIPSLAPVYDKITFVDTTAFMKALYRQRLVASAGHVLGVAEQTKKGAPVDDLLAHNIEIMRSHVGQRINDARSKIGLRGIERMQETPESESSEPNELASGPVAIP